jgi:hypothetical protein
MLEGHVKCVCTGKPASDPGSCRERSKMRSVRWPMMAAYGVRRLAKQLVDGHAIELWQETRKIDRFEPKK